MLTFSLIQYSAKNITFSRLLRPQIWEYLLRSLKELLNVPNTPLSNQAWQHARKKTSLTQNILGAELPQVLELEINIEDGDAPRYGEDDDVAAQDILPAKRESSQEVQKPPPLFWVTGLHIITRM